MSETLTAAQVKTLFPRREEDTHKGDYGYITLIGGCVKYSGAIRLAALAQSAMRSGVGVCTIAAPKSLTDVILPSILESTFYPLSDKEGDLIFDESEMDGLIEKSDVIAIGMGIGNTSETQEAVKYLLEKFEGILVVDADGINAMAKLDSDIVSAHKCKLVITPHPKEFSRLAKIDVEEVLAAPEENAKKLAQEINAIVLLKGHVTTVSDGEQTYLVEKGSPGMATGGSGDVLSGILSAVLASNSESLLLATAGAAYVNGLAGELAAEEHGEVSMVASDTAACIEKAIKQIISEAPKKKRGAKEVICIILFILLLIGAGLYTLYDIKLEQDRIAYEEYLATLDPREEVDDYEITLSFICKDIYIDGILVNNYQLYRPFGEYDDRIYAPLTDEVCAALGIKAEWNQDDVTDLIITKTTPNHSGAFYDLSGWNPYNFIGYASGNVTIYIRDGELEEKLYPDAHQTFRYNDGEVMYVPISMLASSEILGISAFYDVLTGLYISTDPEIPAESYFSENNASYITGRAEYILSFQPQLGFGNCSYYEYLFRHEANTMEVDEDLLLAIARTESKFNRWAVSGAGARGMMQIMPDTAKASGIDPETLYKPDVSIQFGAYYIRNAIKNFNGDLIKALSTYNFGGNAVLAGEYDTAYATTVISRMEAMQEWMTENGYSNEFYTVLECTK